MIQVRRANGPVVGQICAELGYGGPKEAKPRSCSAFASLTVNCRRNFKTYLAHEPNFDPNSKDSRDCAEEFLRTNPTLFPDTLDAQINNWPILPNDRDKIIEKIMELISVQYQNCVRNAKNKAANGKTAQDSDDAGENEDEDDLCEYEEYMTHDDTLFNTYFDNAGSSDTNVRRNVGGDGNSAVESTHPRTTRVSLPRSNKRYPTIETDETFELERASTKSAKRRKTSTPGKYNEANSASSSKIQTPQPLRTANGSSSTQQYRASQERMRSQTQTNAHLQEAVPVQGESSLFLNETADTTISEEIQDMQEDIDRLDQIPDEVPVLPADENVRARVREDVQSVSTNPEVFPTPSLNITSTAAIVTTVSRAKPSLYVILNDWVEGVDTPLSWSEIFRTMTLKQFFNLVCMKAGFQPEEVREIEFRYEWMLKHSVSVHASMDEADWAIVKRKIQRKFEVAREICPPKTEFCVWVTCKMSRDEEE